MTDPSSSLYVPHIVGVTLDTQGVGNSQVTLTNRNTGESLVKQTDANKRVIFDLSDLPSGYSANDVIEFENTGASFGGTTITVNSATGGFQDASLDATAALSNTIAM